ncbi:MAG: STN domain-containing protein [Rikenellaceae bacterium]|nr:STN domain-containing protein [Rikenellaceae bacterium]MCL2691804.1 STN domain-containing protein [Rikenellaceae bacterium]
MKRNDYYRHFPGRKWGKTLFLMKLSIVTLLCSIGTMVAAPSISQQTRLDVSYNRETLGSVLNDLSARTGYQFVYMQDVVPENVRVTLTMANAEIGEILAEILVPHDLDFALRDNMIVITPQRQNMLQQPEPTPQRITVTRGH